MGCGSWSAKDYTTKLSTKGIKTITTSCGVEIDDSYDAQKLYTARGLDECLNPYDVVRECCDTDEHPNTIPVILALDVTGSMGKSLEVISKKLNAVMTELYKKIKDVEILIMGIGDLAYDTAPIQASQFESDIRISEQLDKIYFERGGGGNKYESYTAAWYFAVNNTKLDAWERGKKGILITLGDEPLNPYLPKSVLGRVLGNITAQKDVDTDELYKQVIEKYDVYHFAIDDRSTCYSYYSDEIYESWSKYLDSKHLKIISLDNLIPEIVNTISESESNAVGCSCATKVDKNGEICW